MGSGRVATIMDRTKKNPARQTWITSNEAKKKRKKNETEKRKRGALKK